MNLKINKYFLFINIFPFTNNSFPP
jgi:hypothetical protein